MKGLVSTIAIRPQLADYQEKISELNSDVDDLRTEVTNLSNQLSSSRSEASEAGARLESTKSAFESEVAGLRVTADMLQQTLDQLLLPNPLESEDLYWEGILKASRLASIPLDMKVFQEVKGEFICDPVPCSPYIQDPDGNNVIELTYINQSNFRFVTQKAGRYRMVVANPHEAGKSQPHPSLGNKFSVTYQIVTWYSSQLE